MTATNQLLATTTWPETQQGPGVRTETVSDTFHNILAGIIFTSFKFHECCIKLLSCCLKLDEFELDF